MSVKKYRESIILRVPSAAFLPAGGYDGQQAQTLDDHKLYSYDVDTTTWILQASPSGATGPAGSTTQVQFNNAGAFAGDPDFTFDPTTNLVRIAGTTQQFRLVNNTSPTLYTSFFTDSTGTLNLGLLGGSPSIFISSDSIQVSTGSFPTLLSRSTGALGTAKVYAQNNGTDVVGFSIEGGGTSNLPGIGVLFAQKSLVLMPSNAVSTGGTDSIRFYVGGSASSNERARYSTSGLFIGGSTTATALLHLAAGTASAGTAPLKLTSGTVLGTPESGAVEFDGTHFYITIGSTRYQLDQQATAASSFKDTLFTIQDDGDATKLLAFQCSGITTATTRTLTVPDASGTIALTTAIGTGGTDLAWSAAGGLSVPDAGASARGVITTGTQTIAGAKTFSGTTNFTSAFGSNSSGASLFYLGTVNFIFRTTNGGSNISMQSIFDVDNSNSTAGAQAFGFEKANGFVFTAANGTRRVARAALKLSNLVNTAGSETGDLSFYTKPSGGAIAESFRITSAGGLSAQGTNTASGTTGNQTINKTTGTVNIAASGTTVTVTNSLVSTSSLVFAVIRTNDTTATIKNVVPGSGSFVITLTAAATAEVSIGFLVVNNF